MMMLQQYLPLAVLKLNGRVISPIGLNMVATVLTACGIETVFSEVIVDHIVFT